MTLDEKGRRLHGRVEFFDRNVTQLTKHVGQIIGHHQGESMFAGDPQQYRTPDYVV